jgi:hypothetical protein
MRHETILILGVTNLFLILALLVSWQSKQQYDFSIHIEIKGGQWNP